MRQILLFVALVAGALPAMPFARSPQAPARDAAIAAARTIMAKARYATLVTLGPDGAPQARIVDPFAPEGEMTIWAATIAGSRKVTEVRANPDVSLLYFDTEARGYVTVSGKAEVVTAQAEKLRYWKDDWSAFYRDRNRGDDYVLLKVVATRLELSAPSLGMNNDPLTWKPVIVDLRK